MPEIIVTKKSAMGIRICIEEEDAGDESVDRSDAQEVADALIENLRPETLRLVSTFLDQHVNQRPIGWDRKRQEIPVINACKDPCHNHLVHAPSTAPPGGQCPTCKEFVRQVQGEFVAPNPGVFPSIEDSSVGQDLVPSEVPLFRTKPRYEFKYEPPSREEIESSEEFRRTENEIQAASQPSFPKRTLLTRSEAARIFEEKCPRGWENRVTKETFTAIIDAIIEASNYAIVPSVRVPLTEEQAASLLRKIGRERTPYSSDQVRYLIEVVGLYCAEFYQIVILAIIEASK